MQYKLIATSKCLVLLLIACVVMWGVKHILPTPPTPLHPGTSCPTLLVCCSLDFLPNHILIFGNRMKPSFCFPLFNITCLPYFNFIGFITKLFQ